MSSKVYFGYKCPKCGSTIDIGVQMGSTTDPNCPTCKTKMVPNPDGKTVAANVYCPRCDSSFGLVNSDKCPKCGGPFSKR